MKMTKYKLSELVEVTRGASLSGQFYAEEGKLIRLTLGNFNMNGGGFKENTSKTDLYFTGTVRDEFIPPFCIRNREVTRINATPVRDKNSS